MSESKEPKWLYNFSINKKVEVERTFEEEVNGEKVKVTRKVKEEQPVTFALKRPTRRLYEGGDLFYGVQLAEGIRAGLLTKALLLKRYRNDGGALSDTDSAYFESLRNQLQTLENEHQRLLMNIEKLSETDKEAKINDIVKQKNKLIDNLQVFETVNQALFAHTAETKAQFKLNNWWIIHLAYWDKAGGENFEEFFPGETYEEKMAVWDSLDENRDSFVLEALARFSFLVGLWNAGARSIEDFANGEKEYASLVNKSTPPATPEEPQPAPVTSVSE